MGPLALISGAVSIADALGLGDWIGESFGGKPGKKVAGKIVDIAKTVTGSDSIEDALASIQGNAELAHELRIALMNQETEFARLAVEDRNSARDMQKAALAQQDLFSKRFIYYFAIVWSLFAMAYLTGITFFEIPESSQRFADTALGFLLGTVVAGIIAFFYGDSANSQRKDEIHLSK